MELQRAGAARWLFVLFGYGYCLCHTGRIVFAWRDFVWSKSAIDWRAGLGGCRVQELSDATACGNHAGHVPCPLTRLGSAIIVDVWRTQRRLGVRSRPEIRGEG